MGDQNDTRILLLKTITTEIEGFNSFIEEMLEEIENEDILTKEILIDWMLEDDFLGYIQESILESVDENGLSAEEVQENREEIKKINVSLTNMEVLLYDWHCHFSLQGKDSIQEIVEIIREILTKIDNTGVQGVFTAYL